MRVDDKTKKVIGGGAFFGVFLGAILAPVLNGATSQIIFSSFENFIGFYGIFIGIAISGAATMIFLNLRRR